MLKKLTDLSQLTKAVLKKADAVRDAVPHPQKPAPAPAPEASAAETALSREDADCLAYFSHTSIADSRFATAGRVRTPVAPKRDPESRAENGDRAALAALQVSEARLTEQLAEVRQALVAAEARAVAAESELAASRTRERAEKEARTRLEGELRSLRDAASKTAGDVRIAVSPSPAPSAPPPNRERKGLLVPPADMAEVFPGEVREMVVAALRDACETAEQGARERRAAVLRSVLAANPSSGELERRRAELRQILKDAGGFAAAGTLSDLERIGFRCISGKKHWKLEYGNVRMPMSKTPSDYRSQFNAAADMANRCL